eukprot:TRINITY_DN105519_c0_g1_i1.p1 TRINITY_DN105519_c0_g1~~TRINITY_DN105519_c0_g1_i1.p1  ORF type:complete len:598 (-),score=89.61 TRINITY_DN105519_c0_g1_i1:86-1831(-)
MKHPRAQSRPMQQVSCRGEEGIGLLEELRVCACRHQRELEELLTRHLSSNGFSTVSQPPIPLDSPAQGLQPAAALDSTANHPTEHMTDRLAPDIQILRDDLAGSIQGEHEKNRLITDLRLPAAGNVTPISSEQHQNVSELGHALEAQSNEEKLPEAEFRQSKNSLISRQSRLAVVKDSRRLSHFRDNMAITEALTYNTGICARVVKQHKFDQACALLIMSSSIVVGLEVEFSTASNSIVFDALGNFFMVCFSLELILRACARGHLFIIGSDKIWNFFDSFCVASSYIEIILSLLATPNADASLMTLIRTMRVVRIARIVRVIRFLSKLRMMVFTLLGALKMLGWALILLVMIMYMFAVSFTEASKPFLADVDGSLTESQQKLRKHFRSLPRSMLTLFESIIGGVSWGEPLQGLAEINVIYVAMFLFYICLMILAMLNVLTGLCCEYAIENADSDRDDAIRAQLRDRKKWLGNFRAMFQAIDMDNSGVVSAEELNEILMDEEFQAYLAHLNITVDEAHDLLVLFDKDGDGAVSVDEFIQGCMRVKGQAKAVDVVRVMYEVRGMSKEISEIHGMLDSFPAVGK